MDAGAGARSDGLALAFALMAVAGFTDAVGFLSFGLYPSFLSGDSTNLAVAVARSERPHMVVLGALVLIFTAGAFLGRLVRLRTRRRAAVLTVEAVLLATGGLAAAFDVGFGALACVTLAMGLQNAALSRVGALRVGTYVTGTLVRLGASLADAVAGGARWTWLGDLGLWLALVAGAVVGAAAFGRYDLTAVLGASAAALLMAAATAREPADAPAASP